MRTKELLEALHELSPDAVVAWDRDVAEHVPFDAIDETMTWVSYGIDRDLGFSIEVALYLDPRRRYKLFYALGGWSVTAGIADVFY